MCFMKRTVIEGEDVFIREIRPEDKSKLEKGFESLSKQSILYRFNDPIKRLTPQQLKYLTEVDNRNHVAICAHTIVKGKEHGIGVARYIRISMESDIAEFAITVVDAYQNIGIGTLLLEQITLRAKANGIATLRGYIRADNTYMLSLIRKCKCDIYRECGNYLRADIDITT